jgi:hypothetical protein
MDMHTLVRSSGQGRGKYKKKKKKKKLSNKETNLEKG